MAHSASTDFTRFQFCRKLAWIASWFPPLSPKCRSRPLPPVPVAFADRAARASFDRPSILPDLFVFAFAFFVIAWFRQRWEIDELTPAAGVDHPHGFERERPLVWWDRGITKVQREPRRLCFKQANGRYEF